MRGSLHYAVDDETVHCSGRDDVCWDVVEENEQLQGQGAIQGSLHYGGKSAASGRDNVSWGWARRTNNCKSNDRGSIRLFRVCEVLRAEVLEGFVDEGA